MKLAKWEGLESCSSGMTCCPRCWEVPFFFVLTLAFQGYFWHTRSQSIGKICTKTKIVNLDGSPSNFASIAFKRTLVLQLLITIPVVGQVISLVNALLIFRKDHNCLHDDIAKTRVVKAQ